VNHLGLDVHAKATVWALLDPEGKSLATGKTETTAPALTGLIKKLSALGPLRAGQEVGGQSYFVHDVLRATGTEVLSFNAHQLRQIAASRKKTDRRDAYWIAKSLQTERMPHPVYMPTGPVRELRMLLSLRDAVARNERSWWIRARALARAHGESVPKGVHTGEALHRALQARPEGIGAALSMALEACARQQKALGEELSRVEAELRRRARECPEVKLLASIPGVGTLTALRLHALIGEVKRFPNARALASYAGLVPSVRQSGETNTTGSITGEGSKAIRAALVQSAQSVIYRSTSAEAAPLRQIAARIRLNRSRNKIAIVATARHLLRIAFYVLRDQRPYDAALLRTQTQASEEDAVS